jgi:hypothetical protein
MTMLTAKRGAGPAKAKWLHWLFVQGDRAISCSLDIRGDGSYAASLIPLWSPEDEITETFRQPDEALQWQQLMTQRLQTTGWLLVEGCIVTNAA